MEQTTNLFNEALKFKEKYENAHPLANTLEVFIEFKPYEKVASLEKHSRIFTMKKLIQVLDCYEDICAIELYDYLCDQISTITLEEWEEKIRKPIEEAIKAKKANR